MSIFRLGISAQIGHVQTQVESAAALTAQRLKAYEASFPQTPSSFATDQHRRELTLILQLVLADFKEVEGGFWSAPDGFLAYAYPSYGGGGVPKKDVPEAEAARIADVAQAALNSGRPQTHSFPSETETLILRAQPAAASDARLAVWTMSRAHVRAAAAYQKLTLGFGVLFVFALLSGAGVLWFLQSWTARVRTLEEAIVSTSLEELSPLRPIGERELDRIVNALSQLNAKLKVVRDESRALTEKLAHADRTAALGRMGAQIAHEIRNPIASMRLKAENALAKPFEQQSAALRAMLDEIKRLDDLLERLLAITRLGELRRAPVALKPWLQARIDNLREQAAQINIALSGDAPHAAWSFDEKSMSRTLDNLLLNAVQHTLRGGWINAHAEIRDGRCRIAVENSGAKIAPEQREKIFEPFVGTRGDGAGLGLSIAREIAEAHGGSLRCVESKDGARFEIELPCPKY